MKSVKLALMQRIQEQMPDIARIDEDYGQLENADDQYPLVFPCVLISNPVTKWETKSVVPILQRGEAEMRIRLAIDCYDDTHIGSTTEQRIEERDVMCKRLLKAVHGFRMNQEMSPMCRIESREPYSYGNIKIYETTFEYQLHVRIDP